MRATDGGASVSGDASAGFSGDRGRPFTNGVGRLRGDAARSADRGRTEKSLSVDPRRLGIGQVWIRSSHARV
ncbi:hypothetical protein [Haladaptatus halobius]|uniref:hypothetical protein n=1 Tax=Haladaptatus halobius TaxID=2884875 RepID=UPI001D0BCF0A|nr:hypothetical protein [Haladaptatus halobius]